jgi:ABC-type antimicrobial peptide transport system permease subunit
LGARTYNIVLDVLRASLSVTVVGIATGAVLAAFAARAIAPHITVSPLDPLTFGVVIALVVLAAALAALVPALRATHVDPVVALRYE